MVPSLADGKMSSSDAQSKIGLEDTNAQIKKKVLAAFCEEKNTSHNPVLIFISKFVFNTFLLSSTPTFTILIKKTNETRVYNSYEELVFDFGEGSIHPLDLKVALVEYLVGLISPVRDEILKHKDVIDQAYPASVKVKYEKPKKAGKKHPKAEENKPADKQ